MEALKKVLIIKNEIEAQLLESILNEHNIPHFIKSYHDLVYDGVFQFQKGWGHLEAPEKYHEEILRIYDEL